jgi:hypothetical protein
LTFKFHAQQTLKEFNNTLGQAQSMAFDQGVESFQTFLKINYANQDSIALQNAQFLKDFQRIYSEDPPDWVFPKDLKKLLDAWETCGLRNEIRLWSNESYQPKHFPEWNSIDTTSESGIKVEIDDEIVPFQQRRLDEVQEPIERDSVLSFNRYGKYLYALDQCCSSDTLIAEYVDVKWDVGDLSPILMANAFLTQFSDRLGDPLLMRMIVAELYYWLMFSELKRANKD